MHEALQPLDLPKLVLSNVQLFEKWTTARQWNHLSDSVERQVEYFQVTQVTDALNAFDVIVVQLELLQLVVLFHAFDLGH